MNDRDPMSDARDCGGDPAAYVLGALEPEEVEAFRNHMATCVVCRDEVVAFQQVADALPAAVPQYRAPKTVRRRVLKAVQAEPRAAPGASRPRSWLRFSGLLVPRPALATLAVVVVALVVLAGVELGSGGSSGARVVQASVVGMPGSAEVRVAGGRAELIVDHLPPPPQGGIYEVWLKRGSAAPTPTGTLFSVSHAGAGNVGVAGSLHGVSEVLVTPEPAGGTTVPTHSPVIVARLS